MFGKNTNSQSQDTQQPEIDPLLVSSSDELEDELEDETTETEDQIQGLQSTNTGKVKKKKEDPFDSLPLRPEIIVTGPKNDNGTRPWRCKHCEEDFTSTYTRVHSHFFGGPVGKHTGIRRCREMKNLEKFNSLKKRVEEAEKKGACASLKTSVITKKQSTKSANPLEAAFAMAEREEVDQKIMRFLCANGIAFNVLRSPEFHDMVSAINRAPKGYKAPSMERARTTLLDDCKIKVEKELSPIKETWHKQGLSIISDGWSNVKQQPLINILAENSRGAIFMCATDFSGVEKTGAAIADYLLKGIDEVGPANVVQVVTDNASNCVSAGKEIEQVHKHIFWSPCVIHTVNLIFKDFTNNFEWLRDTYKRGKAIVKYIVNHQHALAMFRSQSKLELLKVAKTRFASQYILLKRLIDCREALVTTVCLNKWKEWVRRGDENSRNKGDEVAATIKDDSFWEEVENIITITRPIYRIIKFADSGGDAPLMGEIYERMDNMLGEVLDTMQRNRYSHELPKMGKIIQERREKMNVPIHCLGFALNPRFYDIRYLQSPAPGGC